MRTIKDARIVELERALKSIRARARFEQTQPTGLHMTCLSLIEKEATMALAGSETYEPELPGMAALTKREEEIMKLVVGGHTNKEIAAQLMVVEKTIKHYLTTIFEKLQVRNRTEAVLAVRMMAAAPPSAGVTISIDPASSTRP